MRIHKSVFFLLPFLLVCDDVRSDIIDFADDAPTLRYLDELVISRENFTLTITSWKFLEGSGWVQIFGTQDGVQLGVRQSPSDGLGVKSSSEDASTLDSRLPREGLLFDFGEVGIQFAFVSFTRFFSDTDAFDFFVDDQSYLTGAMTDRRTGSLRYTFAPPSPVGTRFFLTPSLRSTDYFIHQIGVIVPQDDDGGIDGGPTAVPEPSTLALLGIGLFGMGLARRRRTD